MILTGDSLLKLKELDDNSVDACITDPPYGLSFMGKKWDYDVPSVELWREVLRVLKPGAHVLAFGGTRTYHRLVCAIEDAGFEIRDQVQWIYGQGFPKSHNVGNGFGTALKPANEPICLARKPLEKGLTVAENVLKWNCGALNIDGCRIGREMIQGGRAGRKDASSFNVSIGEKPPAHQGRWPANVLFDEDAAEMLDAQSGVSKSPSKPCFGDSGGASRFFYVAKASKRERNKGLEGMPTKATHRYGAGLGEGHDPNAPALDKNFHPTVKPIKLMEYLIRLACPPNGLVLDPFLGSGSTGVAAKNLGHKFIGIELNPEYAEIAEKRLANAS